MGSEPTLPAAGPGDPEILRFFAAGHLSPSLRAVAAAFGALARELVATLPDCAERAVALRKLLEAKDAAVRAALPLVPPPPAVPRFDPPGHASD